MQLSRFIQDNIEHIMVEWEAFARTLIPPAETMSQQLLRNSAREILQAIAVDMDSLQTEGERRLKSEGLALPPQLPQLPDRSAADHGSLRQLAGFNLTQLNAEYRALRATVLRLWAGHTGTQPLAIYDQINRFNEGIDQALAESIASYSHDVGISRDTFLAVLGHDLRSPLGALSTCIQILGSPEAGVAQKERILQIAKRSVSSIDEMITDLLEYTRTRLGRGIEVVPATGDLQPLCQEACDEVRSAHPKRALVCQMAGDLIVPFDEHRMRQVLRNLLTNAVQHGDAAFPVVLDVLGDAQQVTLTVRNQGKPISPDALQVIFNPLVQIAATQSEPHERPSTSLGLGLYIAREIVVGHGGTITVTSSAAEGTAFAVHLPRLPLVSAAA
ncbi:MAG: sensor histidine kinase [Pseudomonadota bacterium]